jgi:hypothetical protein
MPKYRLILYDVMDIISDYFNLRLWLYYLVSHKKIKIGTGTATITNSGQMQIPLPALPFSLELCFTTPPNPPSPCDPGKTDVVFWSFQTKKNKSTQYFLNINWDINGTRSISWTYKYGI